MDTNGDFQLDQTGTSKTIGKLIVKLRGEGLLAEGDVHNILRIALSSAVATAGPSRRGTRPNARSTRPSEPGTRPSGRGIGSFLESMYDGYVEPEAEFAFG